MPRSPTAQGGQLQQGPGQRAAAGSASPPQADPPISPLDLLILDETGFHPGRVALVAGAAVGLGRALAAALAANGLTVLALDEDPAALAETARLAHELLASLERDRGGRVLPQPVAWARRASLELAVERAAELGEPAYLASVAGEQYIAPVAEVPMAAYDRLMTVMVHAPFYLCKLMIPHLKRSELGGVIGLKSSMHGHLAAPNKALYTMAKFSMRALAASIAAQGDPKVRAFSLSTGFLQTPLALNQLRTLAERRGLSQDEVIEKVMLGRARVKSLIPPVEAANQYVWGFSAYGRALNGGDLLLDGGVVKTY